MFEKLGDKHGVCRYHAPPAFSPRAYMRRNQSPLTGKTAFVAANAATKQPPKPERSPLGFESICQNGSAELAKRGNVERRSLARIATPACLDPTTLTVPRCGHAFTNKRNYVAASELAHRGASAYDLALGATVLWNTLVGAVSGAVKSYITPVWRRSHTHREPSAMAGFAASRT